jgi:hypothetical protein
MSTQRFPLAWPVGWKRTKASDRQRARFSSTRKSYVSTGSMAGQYQRSTGQLTLADALKRLQGELRRLGVYDGDWLLSTNVRLRLDGLPYSNDRPPEDPGAAVYFRLNTQDRVLACDQWDRVADNVGAIAAHIEAMRAIDRYGVGTLDQAFAGYAALPAKGDTWRSTLGFGPDDVVTADAVQRAFRDRARQAHPDVGGSDQQMATLNAARDAALREVRA